MGDLARSKAIWSEGVARLRSPRKEFRLAIQLAHLPDALLFVSETYLFEVRVSPPRVEPKPNDYQYCVEPKANELERHKGGSGALFRCAVI